MKKVLLGLSLYAALVAPVAAQKPAGKTAPKKAAPAPTAAGTTYLGMSALSGGAIARPVFDSLVRQGIRVRDASGGALPVTGFQFTYAERGLFEDSVGNPIVVTEYLTEYCFGDTLSANIRSLLPGRTKPGDTVYVDNVRVRAKGSDALSKPMRFVLTPP